MLPVVCMLRAGLYVGLGAFGIAAATEVFREGAGAPFGIPLGPDGLLPEMVFDLVRASKEFRPLKSSAEGIAIGELCIEEFEARESGRCVSIIWGIIRSFAKRSESASFPLGADGRLVTC